MVGKSLFCRIVGYTLGNGSCAVVTVVTQDVPLVTPSVGARVGGATKIVGEPLVYQLVPYVVIEEEGWLVLLMVTAALGIFVGCAVGILLSCAREGSMLAACDGDVLGIIFTVGVTVSCTVSTVVTQDVSLVTPFVGACVGGTIKFVGEPLVYMLVS